MTSKEIRQSFLDFFKKNQHTIVPSASIVPENDPTLLFTNAGMNQFKDVFLGTGIRPYTRAADTQKCMRVSGKHNDLDDVGKDTYHHTLFEMLGNWSFGDYYKKEAISWAWEFLTKIHGLPKDKLYATVFRTDEEAVKLWQSETDIDPRHIMPFDEKDNFWEMGETGPCGPCSEIHIDLGEGSCNKQHVPGHQCGVNAGCSRFIEIWNLVFIQYNRQPGGTLENLPAKHVDTGMGFERLVMVLQGKKSNYDTDLFVPIIRKIESLSGKNYVEKSGMPFRVIADHIRALTFAIADGIMPSNEGRGYVLRKILRRAVRYGKALGFDSAFLYNIVDTVVEIMGEAFPEIGKKVDMIKSVIQADEDAFFRTINRGMDKLNDILDKAKKDKRNVISGDDVFLLYDSMGFPVDFTEQVVKDENMTLDWERFNQLMGEQKERARAHWKGEGFDLTIIKGKVKPSKYVGEDQSRAKSKIETIVRDNTLVKNIAEGENAVIIVPETPFYGEKGGQVGDKGYIETANAKFEVNDSRVFEDTYLHYGTVVEGKFAVGDEVTLTVDGERKNSIARNHTATHLIHKALKEVVGPHAIQAGSLVSPDRLRFDFTHNKQLTKEELERIEEIVNNVVLKNLSVDIHVMSKEEALKSGAEAHFEEKYGDQVRIINIDNYSIELCGGTHVERTGDIGLVKIISEGSISAGTRRLEALTGLNSLDGYRDYFYRVKELASLLKVDDESVAGRVKDMTETLKQKDREIEELKAKVASSGVSDLIAQARKIGGADVVIQKVNLDPKSFVAAVDSFKQKVKDGVIFLITASEDKVSLIAGVTASLTGKIKAGDIARETAKIVGGGGGGRPDMAQAGGKEVAKVDEALRKAEEMINTALA